ncbi:hypothetical protein AAGS61_12780 [Lysinibacillus sp. KU-BSD001]|uniref:hypothetical protein n=1 Tax=Lysinibacillus sp. KU-BSD001 TaxID=3141328 RepID=UPI0036E698C5
MSPYKLKELRNTERHEQAIIQQVKQNLYKKKKKTYILAPVLAIIVTAATFLFIIGQLKGDTEYYQMASGYTLLNVFEQVDGDGVAYSELFKDYDSQYLRQLTYFKPVVLTEFIHANHVKIPKIIEPFQEANAEVLAVNDGMQTELQFTFTIENENTEKPEYIIISVAKHFMDIMKTNDFSTLHEDAVGNLVLHELLDETTPLMHQIRTTNSALVYRYFTYDEGSNKVNVTATSANELYTYYNGFIYHVGYDVEGNSHKVVSYVKDFILHNNLHELNMEQNTMGEKEQATGGQSIMMAIGILLIGLIVAIVLTKGTTSKYKQIIWGITTMLVIAPLLSWLLGISYGIYEGEGFAAAGVIVILFPILFLTGLVLMIRGIFKKEVM